MCVNAKCSKLRIICKLKLKRKFETCFRSRSMGTSWLTFYFLFQLLFGCLSFLYPKFGDSFRSTYLKIHVYFGRGHICYGYCCLYIWINRGNVTFVSVYFCHYWISKVKTNVCVLLALGIKQLKF